MYLRSRFAIIALTLLSQMAMGEDIAELINYEELDHEIELLAFRAGNHDDSGINDYFFQVTAYGVAILQEERKKEFDQRMKIVKDLGTFGDINLNTLSFWKKDANPPTLEILGEDMRTLMSEAMHTFKISENQVSILIKIQLFERNKQFIFFGEDTMVGQALYHVIPETMPHKPKLENKVIKISDALGTMVELEIKYDALDPKKKKKK